LIQSRAAVKRNSFRYGEISDGGRSLYGQQLVEFQMCYQLSTVSLNTPRSQPDVVVVEPARRHSRNEER